MSEGAGQAGIVSPERRGRAAHALARLGFLKAKAKSILAWPVVATLMAITGWSVLLSDLSDAERAYENTALSNAAGLSRSYAENLERACELVDQIALHVKYEWELSRNSLRLESMERKGLLPSPALLYVAITDRNGSLLKSTINVQGKVSLANHHAFLAQKAATVDFLYIGAPTTGPLTGKNAIPFSRRLVDDNGDFNGIVLISAIPSYFTAGYKSAILGKQGFLGVVGQDREIYMTQTGDAVHAPQAQALLSVPRFPMPAGSFLLDGNMWFSDRRDRYVGWQFIPEYSVFAMAGLDKEEALSQYRAYRLTSLRNAFWNTLAILIFTLIAMGLTMRLAWRKHTLEVAQATYRLATEGGTEGFYIARPVRNAQGAIADFDIADCNRRGAEFMLRRREQVIGRRISELYEGRNSTFLMTTLSRVMETGFFEGDVEVPPESPLAMQWIHLKVMRSGEDLAISVRDISDTKARVEELERRTTQDVLTGLPNRRWVEEYLPRAIGHAAANQTMMAVLFLDLDGFKQVNDTMGHPAGDELLQNAARRLKDAVRPHDHVVRLGGDEFVILIENTSDKEDAEHVAQRILYAFKEGFRLSAGTASVGTSIGISMYPADGTDAAMLMKNADAALYSVKSGSKGNYRFFDREFDEKLRIRLEREAEFRHALEQDQFVMFYQPRLDICTGKASSMEALARWAHPVRGLLGPREFIPLAEETGLIAELGRLLLDKVCAQLAHWLQTRHDIAPVSINISLRQLAQVDIASMFADALARYKLDPGLIEIEVREPAAAGESLEAFGALGVVRQMGVKLLVDNFGTGRLSLSQLQTMNFDSIKVDPTLTAKIENTKEGKVFFNAITTMAHAFGMRVVAGGVENAMQARILKELHCDEIQGFYVSQPLPPADIQPVLPQLVS